MIRFGVTFSTLENSDNYENIIKIIKKWHDDSHELNNKNLYYFAHPLFFIEKENNIGSTYFHVAEIDLEQSTIHIEAKYEPPISVLIDFCQKLDLEFEGHCDYWEENSAEKWLFENGKLYKKELEEEPFHYFENEINERFYREDTEDFDEVSDGFEVQTDFDLMDDAFDKLKYREVEF